MWLIYKLQWSSSWVEFIQYIIPLQLTEKVYYLLITGYCLRFCLFLRTVWWLQRFWITSHMKIIRTSFDVLSVIWKLIIVKIVGGVFKIMVCSNMTVSKIWNNVHFWWTISLNKRTQGTLIHQPFYLIIERFMEHHHKIFPYLMSCSVKLSEFLSTFDCCFSMDLFEKT